MGQIFTIDAQNSCYTGWLDTGIDLIQGQWLTINASGTTQCHPSPGCTSGPDGIGDPGAPHPFVWDSRNFLALIGYVGSIADPCTFYITNLSDPRAIFVGSSYHAQVQQSGRLYFIVNDSVGYFYDNVGSYTAIGSGFLDHDCADCEANYVGIDVEEAVADVLALLVG